MNPKRLRLLAMVVALAVAASEAGVLLERPIGALGPPDLLGVVERMAYLLVAGSVFLVGMLYVPRLRRELRVPLWAPYVAAAVAEIFGLRLWQAIRDIGSIVGVEDSWLTSNVWGIGIIYAALMTAGMWAAPLLDRLIWRIVRWLP